MRYSERYECHATMMVITIWVLVVLFAVLMITGCAQIHSRTTFPDGRVVETDAIELGSTVALKDYRDRMTKDGRVVSVGSASGDVNVQAIQAQGMLLKYAIEGAIQGAAQGLK